MGKGERTQLHALTSLRFFAAFIVVLFHFGGPLVGHAPKAVANIVAAGYVGVSFFFVLSGFVLAYAYAQLNPRNVVAVRSFFFARLARIYPGYLLSIVVVAPFAVQAIVANGRTDGDAAASGIAALGLLQGWFPASVGPWNFPAWSLSAELLFYALFPFALPYLRRVRLRTALTVTFLAAVGLALVPAGRVPVPLLHVPQFLFGVALGLRFSTRPATERAGRGPLMAAVSATLLALVLTQSPRIPAPLLQNGLLAPLFGAVIYGLAQGGRGLAALLSRRWLVVLGEASYALYVFQVPVHDWLLRVAAFDTNRSLHVAGYIVLLVALSVAVHRTVEVPGRRLVLAFATWLFPPSGIGARIPVPRIRRARQAPVTVLPPPGLSGPPASVSEARPARTPGEAS